MLGYFNNEKATKETFDKDGWLRTGDIGYYDKDGFIFLVGRIKEIIKVKGMQVEILLQFQTKQTNEYIGSPSRTGGCFKRTGWSQGCSSNRSQE